MKQMPWPAALLGVASIACVTILALHHVDTTVMIAIVSSLVLPFMGMMYGKVEAVRTQTNGTMTELIATVRRLGDLLAASPAVTTVKPAETPTAPDTPK